MKSKIELTHKYTNTINARLTFPFFSLTILLLAILCLLPTCLLLTWLTHGTHWRLLLWF